MTNNRKITLYGIPNCDTVKKARVWLDENKIAFTFHNFKKDGLTSNIVEEWLTKLDLDTIINRKGTTWRALTEEQKQSANETPSAIALILEFPSIIKRPVLTIQSQKEVHSSVGFKPELFTSIFKRF